MASDRWDLEPNEGWLLVPIVPCPRCGQRYVEDPSRDGRGDPIPLLRGEEEREPPKCDECWRDVLRGWP